MRLLLAPSILFKASICSRKEQGRGGQSAFVRQCHLFPQVTDSYTSPCVPVLSICAQVRAITVQHRPPTKEQDSTTPDNWGIKQDQEENLTFVSLIVMHLGGTKGIVMYSYHRNTCRTDFSRNAVKETHLGLELPRALLPIGLSKSLCFLSFCF